MLSLKHLSKFLILILAAVICLTPAVSYARHGDHDDRRDYRHNNKYRHHERPRFGMIVSIVPYNSTLLVYRGSRYYYADGLFYSPVRGSYILVSPPEGVFVPYLPVDFFPIVINGATYYTDNETYYVFTRHGYQVVHPPRVHVVTAPVVVTERTYVTDSAPNRTKVAEGAWLGGILGAVTGGIVGHQMKGKHEVGGALIGGAAGAAAGGILGAQIPNQTAVVREASAPVYDGKVIQAPAVTPVSSAASSPADYANEEFKLNIPDSKGGFVLVIIKRSGTGFVGPQGEYYSEFPKVSQLQAMYAK